LESKSLRFAVIGDSGTDEREQYEVAKETEICRQKVGFDFVIIMLGDNIYGAIFQRTLRRSLSSPTSCCSTQA
jgi:hypothetical protein